MSALLERPGTTTPTPPAPIVATPPPAPPEGAPARPTYAAIDTSALAGNPVAAAHERRANRPERDIDTGRIGRILVLAVVVPTILFLVSNPVGWILLFFTCLGVGAITGMGSIL